MRAFLLRTFAAGTLAAAYLVAQPALRTKVQTAQSDPGAGRVVRQRSLGRSHRIIQFDRRPSQEQLDSLQQRGITVLGYVPDTGFLVTAGDLVQLGDLGLLRDSAMAAEEKVSAALEDTGQAIVFVVEFHPDVSDGDARAVVLECGLGIQENPELVPGQLLVSGQVADAARLAEWDEVAYIFPASEDLIQGGPVLACAGPLTELGPIAQYIATVGDGWGGPARNAVQLKYSFERLTVKLAADTSKPQLLKAMAEWSRAVQVSFDLTTDITAPRSLNFLFAAGAHGDLYPFDGPGHVLAHTFYPAPPNSEPLAGDLHFDDDESWQSPAVIDLYSVVLHELGHALGLGHSDKPGAVMYPYYRKLDKLTDEDIRAIQSLYPSATANKTPSTTPAAQPAPPSPPSQPQPPPAPRDTVAPSLSITSPSGTNVITSASTIVLRGTARDNVGVTQVNWTSSTGASGVAQGTAAWATPAIPLIFGATTLIIRAKDRAGNVGWRAVVVTRR
jgi:hypothetical protein